VRIAAVEKVADGRAGEKGESAQVPPVAIASRFHVEKLEGFLLRRGTVICENQLEAGTEVFFKRLLKKDAIKS
jgi:hypothetical protein